MRQILVKVWQGTLTPRQALNKLARAGPLLPDKRKIILDLLSAIEGKEITINEAEQELREEGVEYGDQNLFCQAN